MTQPWPVPPPARTRTWPLAVLALLAVALSTVAVIVSVVRPGSSSGISYTREQTNAAKANLCERFKLADEAASIETNGSDIALARMSATNAAVILEAAASDPALNDQYRSAAVALASSYETMTASGSKGTDDAHFRASIDDVNAKTQILQELCGD